MARRQSRGRSRGMANQVQRKWIWARSNGSGIINAEAPLNIDLLGEFQEQYGAQLLGATVMRVRADVIVGSQAVTEGTVLCGVRVYTENDLASEEGPLTNPHADWMTYKASQLVTEEGLFGQFSIERYELDVKSARKIEELGQGLMISWEHDVVATAVPVRWTVSVGAKLP